MAVYVDMLGTPVGGGPRIIPPERVMPVEFEDDFHRPRGLPDLPEVSGGSLGPWWIVQWLQSNDARGPIRPTIDAGTCAWVSRMAGNPSYSTAVPIYLTWMAESFFFDQYVEMKLAEIPTTTDWTASMIVSHTINPGAGPYTPTINSSPGFYEVVFGPSQTPGMVAAWMNRVYLGQSLSDVDGSPFAMTFTGMTSFPDSPVQTLRRFEARNINDAQGMWHHWDFKILYDGEVVGHITDSSIAGGMPGMGVSQGAGTTNANPIVKIDYFKGGWLPPQ